MINWRRLEKQGQEQLGSLLFLALIAVSAFLVGSQYRLSSSDQNAAAATVDTAVPADSSSDVIQSIQASIEQGTAPTDTAAAAPTPKATSVTGLVSINTGTLSELDTLPGIGPSYAQAIIDYRSTHGAFIRLEDLQQVKGIGPKTYEKLKDKITL